MTLMSQKGGGLMKNGVLNTFRKNHSTLRWRGGAEPLCRLREDDLSVSAKQHWERQGEMGRGNPYLTAE